jgi:hypothetical protein
MQNMQSNAYSPHHHSVLLLFLFILLLAFEEIADAVFELLPWVSVEPVAELAVVVHLSPAVTAPFASCHVDHEVTVLLLVVDIGIVTLVSARTGWEAHNLALIDERNVWANPWLVLIHVLESILLFVFPLHVLLFVAHGIPPDIQKPIGPHASSNHERPKVEAAAVLWKEHIDRINLAISHRGLCFGVEVGVRERMSNIQGIVNVDISIRNLLKPRENVLL